MFILSFAYWNEPKVVVKLLCIVSYQNLYSVPLIQNPIPCFLILCQDQPLLPFSFVILVYLYKYTLGL